MVVTAFETYTAPDNTITQTWFTSGPATDATTYMNSVFQTNNRGVLNGTLSMQLAGLKPFAFQLQPGVEIDSSSQTTGLLVSGDLDLSGYRFQAVGAAAGITQPGAMVIRAGGDLTIEGNITDGFTGAPTLEAVLPGSLRPQSYTFQELAQPDTLQAQSWSIRLVAGADLNAADSRIVLPADKMIAEAGVPVPGSAATDPAGSIKLYDPHSQPVNSLLTADQAAAALPGWSVIRTGTGDLDVLAAGSIDEQSTYAIYTAGTSPALTADSAFNMPRGTSGSFQSSVQMEAWFYSWQPEPPQRPLMDPIQATL